MKFIPIKSFFPNKESKKNKNVPNNSQFHSNSKEILGSLKYHSFQKAPILVFCLIFVITVNLILFLLPFRLDKAFSQLPLHIILFANHGDSVTLNHQYWRLFTFFFAENMMGWWEILFSIFFIWIVFVRVLYFQEIITGSKKTFFTLFIGICIIALLQVFLTKHDSVYYYGTRHLSWITVGSLLFVYIFKSKNNEQLKILVGKFLVSNILILVIYEILRYQSFNNGVYPSSLSFLSDNYILFPMLSVFLGFILNLSLEFKKLPQISQYLILILFIIFLIIIIVFGYFKYSIDNSYTTARAIQINKDLQKIFQNIT